MQPKDLLEHLEKGDRTMLMLKPKDDEKESLSSLTERVGLLGAAFGQGQLQSLMGQSTLGNIMGGQQAAMNSMHQQAMANMQLMNSKSSMAFYGQ